MRCVRTLPALLLALLGLAACSDSTSNNPNTPNSPDEPNLTALVVGEASSPFLDVLSERADMVQDNGSQDVANHDLVIFDGDTHNPAALAEHPRLAEAIKGGAWVLVADSTEAHKQEGTVRHLGFASQNDSDAHLFRSVPGDMPIFDIIELPPLTISEPPNQPYSDEKKAELLERQHRSFVELVAVQVGDEMSTQQSGGCSSPLSIPTGILYATWCYSYPVNWGIDWAENAVEGSRVYAGDSIEGHEILPQAGQNAVTYTFTLLLNNQNEVTGNSQSLHVAVNGQMTPSTTKWPSGVRNYLTGNPYLISDWLLVTGDPEPTYGWPQSKLDVGIGPTQSAASVLQPAAGTYAPQTPNNSQTFSYTSGTSFSIGATLNASSIPKPGGGGSVSGQYTVSDSNTESKTVTDWTWVANAAGPLGSGYSWTFKSQNPPTGESGIGSQWSKDWRYRPNQLLRNLMAYSMAGLWTTSSLSNQTVDFEVSSVQSLPLLSPSGLGSDVFEYFLTGEVTQGETNTVSIDLSTVIPVTLAEDSLTFTDSNGNIIDQAHPVAAGEDVTATVNLTGPAPFSYSISSSVATSFNNAFIAESPVSIAKGDSSKSFRIGTNGNDMVYTQVLSVPITLGSFGSSITEQLYIVKND